MKKISMIFLSLLVITLITGCSDISEKERKLVCTTTETEEGMSIEQIVSMTYKNDKLKHMTIEVNTTITDADVKENWEVFKNSMDKDNEEFDKDGVSLKVSVDNQNYKYNTMLDIDVENTTEEALKEHGFEGLKNDTSTLEDNRQVAVDGGAVCEIK